MTTLTYARSRVKISANIKNISCTQKSALPPGLLSSMLNAVSVELLAKMWIVRGWAMSLGLGTGGHEEVQESNQTCRQRIRLECYRAEETVACKLVQSCQQSLGIEVKNRTRYSFIRQKKSWARAMADLCVATRPPWSGHLLVTWAAVSKPPSSWSAEATGFKPDELRTAGRYTWEPWQQYPCH